MRVGRFSIPQGGDEVLAMRDAGLDTRDTVSLSVWFRWGLVYYDGMNLVWQLE
jgi:hypothetical protein